MVIRQLALTNFRRFRRVEIEFPENLIGIIGRNGAGKTTLVEAIAWALYGNRALTGLGRGRQDKESLRSAFAGDGDRCRVELVFEVGGHEYHLVREIRGKSAAVHAQITRDGAGIEADRDSGVTEFVERLVGLDAASFRSSVFARQRELAAFSGMRPEERKRTVNRLVGIDLIDRARELVREDRRNKQNYVLGLEKGLEDLEGLKEKLKQTTARRKSLEEQIAQADSEVKRLLAQEAEAQRVYEVERERQVAHLKLEGQIKSLATALEHLQKRERELKTEFEAAIRAGEELRELQPRLELFDKVKHELELLDELAAERRRLPDLESQLKGRTEQSEKRRTQLEALQKRKEELAARAEALQRESSRLEALLAEEKQVQEDLATLENELGGIERLGNDLKSKRKLIEQEGPGGRCPVCRQPLEQHFERALAEIEAELDSLRKQYREAKSKHTALTERKEELQKELESARRAAADLQGVKSKLEEVCKQAESLQRDIESLDEEKASLQASIQEIERKPFDAQRHAELKKKHDELVDLKAQAAGLEAKASRRNTLEKELADVAEKANATTEELQQKRQDQRSVGFDAARFEAAKENVATIRRTLDEAKHKREELKTAFHVALSELSQLRERIRKQEELRENLKRIRAEISDLESLDALYSDFRIELGGRLRPLLEERTSELVRQTTNGRYVLVALSNDYDLSLYDQNVLYPLSRFSGGEQDLVNLCFRVAISRVVAERAARNPVNFIVLDEVFGSQDEERRGQILEALQGLSHHFRQIFLITHIEGVRETLPVVLEVREKSAVESTVAVF